MQMYPTCQCDELLVQRVILWIGSDVSIFFLLCSSANKLFVFVSELIALGK